MIKRALSKLMLATGIAFAALVTLAAQAYTIDTSIPSPSRVSGLWYDPQEPGWGVNLEQQGNVIFVTMFMYDQSGNPAWYVASNCVVSGDRCNGDLYRVTGGQRLSTSGVSVGRVGSFQVTFTDVNSALMAVTIDNWGATRQIRRQVFASAPPPAAETRRQKTERLLGGTWSFTYTLISTYTDRFTFTRLTGPDATGDYLVLGTDQTGGTVGGGFVQSIDMWIVANPGILFDEAFAFNFENLNRVSGCYYLISPPGSSNIGRCYSMTGTRSPAKGIVVELSPEARAAREAARLGEASVEKGAITTDPAVAQAYLQVRRALAQ
jgi:hypothetical protein